MFIRGLASRALCQLTEKGRMLGPMLILQQLYGLLCIDLQDPHCQMFSLLLITKQEAVLCSFENVFL